MKEKTKEVILKLLKRGAKMYVADKFADISFETEADTALRATEFYALGKALGETLESVDVPTEWRRFLKRKDCPQYLKKITTYSINAYYPKLSLPEEKNWIAIDRGFAHERTTEL